jgi:hypothetical protein
MYTNSQNEVIVQNLITKLSWFTSQFSFNITLQNWVEAEALPILAQAEQRKVEI